MLNRFIPIHLSVRQPANQPGQKHDHSSNLHTPNHQPTPPNIHPLTPNPNASTLIHPYPPPWHLFLQLVEVSKVFSHLAVGQRFTEAQTCPVVRRKTTLPIRLLLHCCWMGESGGRVVRGGSGVGEKEGGGVGRWWWCW